MSLPRVPLVCFGIIFVRGDEGNVSLHEVCEGSLSLPLIV